MFHYVSNHNDGSPRCNNHHNRNANNNGCAANNNGASHYDDQHGTSHDDNRCPNDNCRAIGPGVVVWRRCACRRDTVALRHKR